MSVVRDTTTSRDISTDAGFRAWASMIHSALSTVGLVNTADTGQINLATVTTPASNNTFAGYEIWRFNDANQGSDPIFLKIEYGRAAAAANGAIRITTGSGSDGAGNITGTATAATQLISTATAPSGGSELHVCHVAGTLVFYEAAGTNTVNLVQTFVVERYRDASGAVLTSTGIGWCSYASVGYGVNTALNERKGGSTNAISMAALGTPTGAAADGKKRLVPFAADVNYPGIGVVWAKSSEVAAGDSGTASIYATSRTFRVMTAPAASFAVSSPMVVSTAVTCRLCLLDE